MSIVVSTLEPPCSDSCGILENPGTCQGQTLPEVLKDVFTDIRIPPIRSSSIHTLDVVVIPSLVLRLGTILDRRFLHDVMDRTHNLPPRVFTLPCLCP